MDPLLSALVYSIGFLDIIDILAYFTAHVRGDKLYPATFISYDQVFEISLTDDNCIINKDTDKNDFDESRLIERKHKNEKPNEENMTTGTKTEVDYEKPSNITTNLGITGDGSPKNQTYDDFAFAISSANSENITQDFIDSEKEGIEQDVRNTLNEPKLRPISRDDELRHHRIKRSSISSVSSHGSRKEELEALSALEAEEQGDENFAPIVYTGTNYVLDLPDDIDYLETIPETGSSSNDSESSPKPNFSSAAFVPWSDLNSQDTQYNDKSLTFSEVAQNAANVQDDNTILLEKNNNLIGIKYSKNKKEADINSNFTIDERNVKDNLSNSSNEVYIPPFVSSVETPVVQSYTSSLNNSFKKDDTNLKQSEVNVMSTIDNNVQMDPEIIEYYWKPGSTNVELKLKKVEGESHKVHKNLVSTESGNNLISGRRKKSHSVAYESINYDRVAARQLSLAETLIIPKHLSLSNDKVSESIVALENEAEEYKQIWGINIHTTPLTENERIPRRRSSCSQSIDSEFSNVQRSSKFTDLSKISQSEDLQKKSYTSSMSFEDDYQETELPSRIRSQSIAFDSARFQRRRTSLAETIIIPRSIRESGGIDFQTLAKMEMEAEAYKSMWGLDVSSDTSSLFPKISQPVSRTTRSQSISMGVLARRGMRKKNRRSSVADIVLVPRTLTEDLSDDQLAMLENEALTYQQTFNLVIPDIQETDSDFKEAETKVVSLCENIGFTNTDKGDTLTPIHELPEMKSRSNSPQIAVQSKLALPQIDYNFNDEDEELMSITSKSLNVEENFLQSTTSAYYEDNVQHFSDQQRSDINVDTVSSKSPTLEIYLAKMQESSSSYKSSAKMQLSSATHEASLERMQSETAVTLSSKTDCTKKPAVYEDYMLKFPDQLCPDINVQAGPSTSPTLEMYLQEMERGTSKSKLSPTLQSPPTTLEVYLERMHSKSPSPSC